ncbi:MAG: sulfatase [Planctomycetota bacterium]
MERQLPVRLARSKRISSKRLAVLLASIILHANLHASTRARATSSPNFVVILTDDQSWVGSSIVMDERYPESVSDSFNTPNMARISEAGMRFTDAYAPAPYCCPTRRALLVGQSPARHVYQKNRDEWFKTYANRLTIPRMLKSANPEYHTAHLGKWDFRFDLISPEELGYDVSDGRTSNREGGGRNSSKRRSAITEDPKLVFDLTRRACDFIRDSHAARRPFYLQLSHYAVHLDIYACEASLAEAERRGVGQKHNDPRFAAMTEDLDESIGLLLDELQSLQLLDNTYIFFMSDNGGRSSLPEVDADLNRNHPLRSGKGRMYEGGIRVPMFASGPSISSGSVCNTPVTGLDLLPTLADLAGYASPLPADLDGGSLVPLFEGGGEGSVVRETPFLIFHHAYNRQSQSALRLEQWKLVRTGKRLELFDLSQDLSEAKDLSQIIPGKTAELERMMLDYLTTVDAEMQGGTKARPRGKKKPAIERDFDRRKSTRASL